MSTVDSNAARLVRLWLFPVKALDGVLVPEATLTAGGGLVGDRRWALMDPQGHFINGKQESAMHRIRAGHDVAQARIRLWREGQPETTAQDFSLMDDGPAICDWLGDVLKRTVMLVRSDEGGFPDDPKAPGPTLIGDATLDHAAAWFENLDGAGLDRRLRTNLVVGGQTAFWEDHLYGAEGAPVTFRVGDVALQGLKPCKRCVVPSRDPATGEPTPEFQKHFMKRREETLPAFAERSRFDHFYRLAVCTQLAPDQAGKTLRVGDSVELMKR